MKLKKFIRLKFLNIILAAEQTNNSEFIKAPRLSRGAFFLYEM